MKKIVLMLVLAVLSLTSCTKEKFDTLVEWGFAKDTNSEIENGLETMLASAQVIFNAFDTAFYHDYENLGMQHEAMMKLQEGEDAAARNAKKTADKAHSMIEAGHVCPANYIFVVRIKYGGEGKYKTVWSHDYRGNN